MEETYESKSFFNLFLYFFVFIFQSFSDGLARKAAGRELTSLETVFSEREDDINLPIMCLVDYKGFRVIGFSFLNNSLSFHPFS